MSVASDKSQQMYGTDHIKCIVDSTITKQKEKNMNKNTSWNINIKEK